VDDIAGTSKAMNKMRKDMSQELKALQKRVRALLHANMGEVRRTAELLRDTERMVEDQFGHLDTLETEWERAGKKFRKQPNGDAVLERNHQQPISNGDRQSSLDVRF
jgi:HSP90 family molecular chaperone